MDGCIFCSIVAGTTPAVRVREDARTLAFMDINPGTKGHALVVPKVHSESILDADAEDVAAVAVAAREVARAAVQALGADGVNIIQATGAVAFQTVFHLHFHVVPRYLGDGIVMPWVPRPGDLAEIAAAGALMTANL